MWSKKKKSNSLINNPFNLVKIAMLKKKKIGKRIWKPKCASTLNSKRGCKFGNKCHYAHSSK